MWQWVVWLVTVLLGGGCLVGCCDDGFVDNRGGSMVGDGGGGLIGDGIGGLVGDGVGWLRSHVESH